MNARRSPALAVVLIAVGGLLVLLTGGRQWAHGSTGGKTGLDLTVTGHQVSSAIPATAIALLALAVATLASSGFMRRLVGLVVVMIGVTAVGVAIHARGHVSAALADRETGATGTAIHATANGWWVLAAIGGLLALAGGVLIVARSGEWSRMGEKYDAPSSAPPTKDPGAVTWDALDRGEDPTE